MADEGPSADETQVKFTVKTSKDAKYELSLPLTTTIADVKKTLSTPEYADITTDRIRLIYSGRVLKDPDTLSAIKIKDGHTIHLVQGAASNARQNPAQPAPSSSTSTSSTTGTQNASIPQLPNMATGTGNNPLAGITGARYAGFHGLPGMDMFGPDGGMGAQPNPDDMLRMMENPMFLSQMNEAMNNPAVIEMMQNSPMLRDNPVAREMLRSPEFRRMLLDPTMIRAQLQMQRAMGGGGANAFPAPGATNTTPAGQPTSDNNNTSSANPTSSSSPPPPFNPFAMPGAGAGAGGAGGANPFAALFGPNNPMFGNTPATSPPAAASVGQGTPAQAGTPSAQSNEQPNPFAQMMQQMMQSGIGQPPSNSNFQQGGGAAANPFAALFGPGGFGAPAPPQPEDNRPPEDRYADQLRQLNDMGFYDFDRNVQALRRSGGSVQGAIDYLLNNP